MQKNDKVLGNIEIFYLIFKFIKNFFIILSLNYHFNKISKRGGLKKWMQILSYVWSFI